MNPEILKPDLDIYFNHMSLIGLWLKAEYNDANTFEEILNLMHRWFDEAETATNIGRKSVFKASAYYLYSFLTGKSFESNFEIN